MATNKKSKSSNQQISEVEELEKPEAINQKLEDKIEPEKPEIIDGGKVEPEKPETEEKSADIKSVIMTNLTKNPIELSGVDPRVKQLILPGCMVRVPTEKYHELMKNPMVRRWIDNEIIRCSDHGIVEDLNNRASVEKAPAHLTSDVIIGESKASVEKFGVVGNINPESL